MEEDIPVDHPLISKTIENAREKVEAVTLRSVSIFWNTTMSLTSKEVVYRQRRRSWKVKPATMYADDLRYPTVGLPYTMKNFPRKNGIHKGCSICRKTFVSWPFNVKELELLSYEVNGTAI